jgi:hypothetical protein
LLAGAAGAATPAVNSTRRMHAAMHINLLLSLQTTICTVPHCALVLLEYGIVGQVVQE